MESKQRRPAMKPTTEAVQRWAESLRQELEQWAGVTVKRVFGMVMVYRAEIVFAALPGTCALFEKDALLIKFVRESPALLREIAAETCFAAGTMHQRGKREGGEGRKWHIYLLREERDVREAVEWLAQAYELAKT